MDLKQYEYFRTDLGVLYCADCLSILPELEPVDLVLTDPPYSFKHIDGGGFARKAKFYSERRLKDICTFDFEKIIPSVFSKSGYLIAFHSRDQIPEYAEFAVRIKASYDLHVWHKTNAVPFTNNTWKSDLEYIAHIWNKKPGWGKLSQEHYNKAYIAPLETNRQHPAQKPMQLILKYLMVLEPKNILDPFLGSGTTAVACERLGRRWIGIEISEEYCEIAAKRIDAEARQGKLFA